VLRTRVGQAPSGQLIIIGHEELASARRRNSPPQGSAGAVAGAVGVPAVNYAKVSTSPSSSADQCQGLDALGAAASPSTTVPTRCWSRIPRPPDDIAGWCRPWTCRPSVLIERASSWSATPSSGLGRAARDSTTGSAGAICLRVRHQHRSDGIVTRRRMARRHDRAVGQTLPSRYSQPAAANTNAASASRCSRST